MELKYKKDIWLGDKVKIGENCKIQPYAFIPDGVTLEDDVFIAPGVVFTNDRRPPSNGKHWASTLVKKGAIIGANSTILPGVTIGEKAFIGAGSTVTKDIPDGEIWVGNPAKPLKAKKWKWAVIGDKGFVAKRHIQSIEEIGDEVFMSWDEDIDYKEIIKSDKWQEVDAVAICTPNYLHFPIMYAMKDKIIICEKPLCLSSREIDMLGEENVNVVLQLRHHPEVIKWKKLLENKEAKQCDLTVKMFRDNKYWNGWKGDNKRSGGILFNLGIHYFDLLIHLFGHYYEIKEYNYSDKKCTGKIMFGNTEVNYHIEIIQEREGQTRKLEIDGEEVVLSVQDNLSYEGLHTAVYKQVKKGEGLKPSDAYYSIRLVEKLCQDKINA